ncbi:autotransporter outer membrane beta-barrel domain-containing protein [uncultured Phascolarctobacterium sp.]|uniref:autotransporter outer membrane beta-barrel domain-containing protein n=1 Tax=uncultured Phascolarctobacterium sp. TaxID=512296 RepID=UPI0027D94141|nr:autotransporter outer membrane beta-barrel domain-containing protein [uncultured Phascolarctobacterium sp.]
MMRRKHLERAVLLSLLLANVCRVGGATEYSTTITGQESGYDSIKVVDPATGEITYTFAGENTIKDAGAGNTFYPICVEYEKVAIDVGDKLDALGNKASGAPELSGGDILARSTDAALKFTGGELNLTDLSKGSTQTFLVKASEGGSIIFANKVTNISAGNENTNSKGLVVTGIGSKISFSDEAEELNISSVMGIEVTEGGSFEFNNANGNVHIDTSLNDGANTIDCGIYVQDGSLNIKGKETIIKAVYTDGTYGAAAVEVSAMKDLNPTAKVENNLLNFDAEKTVLQGGGYGLYIGGSEDADYTGDTTINFNGITKITAMNNGIDSLGSRAVSSNNLRANINFAKHVTLEAVTTNTGNISSAFGAQIERGSVLKALEGMDVSAKANTAKAVGLGTYGNNSLISVTGATVITAESTSGQGIGIQGWVGSDVALAGTLEANAKSESGKATGLWSWDSGSINVSGDAVINAVSASGEAIGINSNDNSGTAGGDASLTQIGGKAEINVSAGGDATGIYSDTGGRVQVDGAATINIEGGKWNAKGMNITAGGTGTFGSDVYINMGVAATDPQIGFYVRAITANGDNSKVNIAGNAVFNLAGVNTIGLDVTDKGAVTIDGDFIIKSQNNKTFGGSTYGASDATARGIGAGIGTSVTVKGSAAIDINSAGGEAYGIEGGTHINKSAKITVNSLGGATGDNKELWWSSGIKNWNGAGNATVIGEDAFIDVTADISSAMGVYCWNNSNAEIGGNAVVTVRNAEGSVIAHGLNADAGCSITVGKSAQINVEAGSNNIKGIYSHESGGSVTIGESAYINVGGVKDADGKVTALANYARGITGESGATVAIGGSTATYVTGKNAIGIESFVGSGKTGTSSVTIGTAGSDNNYIAVIKGTGDNYGYGDAAKGMVVDNSSSITVHGGAGMDISSAMAAVGIEAKRSGKVTVDGLYQANVRTDTEHGGWKAEGIVTDSSTVKLGSAAITVTSKNEKYDSGQNSLGIYSNINTNVAVANDAVVEVTADKNNALGLAGSWNSTTAVGGSAQITVSSAQRTATGVKGDSNMTTAIGGDAVITATGAGNTTGVVNDVSTFTVGGNAVLEVVSTSGDAIGLDNRHFDTADGKSAGKIEIKGAANITAVSNGDGKVWGIYNYNGAVTDVGSAAAGLTTVTVRGNGGSEIKGIEAMKNSSVAMHGAAFVDVRGDSSTEVIGVVAGNSADTSDKHSEITFGGTAYIKVGNNAGGSKARDAGETFGVVARNTSEVSFAGDTVIDTSGTAAGSNTKGAYANGGSSIEFAKGLVLDNKGRSHSLYVAGTGSSLKVNSSGSGDVYLTGDITAINEGTLELDLSTDKSYYEGAATTETDGKLHMKLRQGSLWNVTADSNLTSLEFGDGAVLDMAQAAGYQNLRTESFTGSGAAFVLGTDIMNDKSDKVYITNSTPTGTAHHNIQIKDAGHNTGDDLHLLLVDDASGNYTFTAQDAYGGGIYNYKAEISNETDGGIKWYLESLKTAGVTEDVRALSRVSDGIYALAVTGNDSLRGRLGELRDDNAEQGVWTRVYGGRLKGDNFSENYQTYQIGYDLPFAGSPDSENAQNWRGGAAFEYTKGSIGYGVGSGENKMTALAMYGTKHTRSGDNVDIILKHGRIKGDIKTYGIGADSGDYDTNATALSVEYNKRLAQTKNIFIEPQVQLTLTHIAGSYFTTDRGITVRSGGINSAVGRLGMAVGKQYKQGNVYFKTSLLHEFGGSSDLLMTSAGESYGESKQYGGTWCELALGGNMQLGKASDLYFDVARSFGGDFQKQWQLNAGVRWSF